MNYRIVNNYNRNDSKKEMINENYLSNSRFIINSLYIYKHI